MNERILEIHRQVMLWSDTPDCPDKIEWCKGQIPEEYTKKFAELIVRQCMDLVKDCYAESGRSLYQSVCASTIIEEHFGVEE